MSILSFLQGIFGSKADRDNKAYRSYVESKINVLTDEFKALSNDELRARIADIRKAVHDAVADKEAEIKSIRAGKCTFSDAWVEVSRDKNQLWLVGAHIDEYFFAKRFGHEPQRKRKLLAHISEIQKMRKATEIKGLTLIPLKLYFKNRYAKLEIGLCRGKDQRDKRADIIARDEKLAIARIVKAGGRR